MPGKPTYDREKTLEKALTLFWEKGFQGTSMKDLEAGLGMHPGSIYAAFGSKEKLFRESLERYAGRSLEKLEETFSSASSPIDGLAAHVRSLGQLNPESGPARACMLVKTVLETSDDDPVIRKTAESLLRGVENAFAEAFEKALRDGELPKTSDPKQLAVWLQMQIFGLRAYAQRSDAGAQIGTLAENIARSVEHLREVA